MPKVWANVHARLRHAAEQHGLPDPPVPLILAGWAYSSDAEKAARWMETITWAEHHRLQEEVSNIPREGMYPADERIGETEGRE